VARFFANAGNRRVIRRLVSAGVLTEEPSAAARPGKLSGKTFVLTGTLERFTRDQARAAIEGQGGRVTWTVSRRTDFVVAGTSPGAKLAAARRLGVPTLDEAAFVALLRQAA
jgi:DNA ligase (NAD+)